MAVINLRTLYELRKLNPLAHRVLAARIFFAKGKYGLIDETGTLWPVYFRPGVNPPSAGDIVKFKSSSFRPDGAIASKYEDSGYFLVVEEVVDIISSSGSWPAATIDSPLPAEDEIPVASDVTHTCFFMTALHRRLQRLKIRSVATERARAFFSSRGFLQAQTSTLVPSGGIERYLVPFKTTYGDHRKRKWTLDLPTSPEFGLKKLLIEGSGDVFQIARAFRNEGQLSQWHEPEFDMLEWYRTGAPLEKIMEDTERVVNAMNEVISSPFELPEKWERFTVSQLFADIVKLNLDDMQQEEVFRTAAAKLSDSIVESDDWESIFCKLFMEKIEPELKKNGACIVSHYPVQMAALAMKSENPNFALRFEAYLNGVEICNGYQELHDGRELSERLNSSLKFNSESRPDEIFEAMSRFGLPFSSGNAMGIERVIAVLMGSEALSDFYAAPFLSQFPADTVADE